ncbi:MAG: 3-phosphoserine/phosphohydroxythreonine transaminase [Bordetella sp.]|nr:MAG: 3-phosphoserine/phosphohydroxythreonine transaminase [Bordetella sp.]
MSRPWNFSAGPAALPEVVLQEISSEMLDWHGKGISVMEMSHRSDEFYEICNEAEYNLRELLSISEDYSVLFMQGGGIGQNAILPMNLIAGKNNSNKADFIITGYWSNLSYKEAKRYGDIHIAASNNAYSKIDNKEQKPWTWIPDERNWNLRKDASYLHICSNETIDGVEFSKIPNLSNFGLLDTTLVMDASSNFLSVSLEMNKLGAVFATAQKNAGSAGVTIVIVRKDLIGKALPICPSVFDYLNVSVNHSCYNTPPTFSIYVSGLIFKWIKKSGGIKFMEINNKVKSSLIYDYIDSTSFYENYVCKSVRSRMNIPFFLKNHSLNKIFLEKAKLEGLIQLKGHKSVGGIRASLYNAMQLEGVQALVTYMKDFERLYG